jgi:hypothetical protein
MTPQFEKRMLQAVVAIACLVPINAGAMGAVRGPQWFKGVESAPVDMDSHLRYLSGILLAMGFAFASCVPDIEAKGERFRLLGMLVVVGGLCRLLSMVMVGVPSRGHVFGLGMELVVVPVLLAWQWRIDQRFRAIVPPRGEAPHPLLGKKKVFH